MWTYWRVSCQQLHLHHFRVKACFRFYLQVDAWTAVPSICRHAHKNIFCLQGAQRFNHVSWDQWKAAITDFILLAGLSWPTIGSISRGWNARLPSEGVIDLACDFSRPIVLRYNFVPCDSITWLLDLVFKGPVLRHNCRLPVIVTSLYQIHDTFVRIFW